MRTPQYIQANCTHCHTDVYDIKPRRLYQGRQLFTHPGVQDAGGVGTSWPGLIALLAPFAA